MKTRMSAGRTGMNFVVSKMIHLRPTFSSIASRVLVTSAASFQFHVRPNKNAWNTAAATKDLDCFQAFSCMSLHKNMIVTSSKTHLVLILVSRLDRFLTSFFLLYFYYFNQNQIHRFWYNGEFYS